MFNQVRASCCDIQGSVDVKMNDAPIPRNSDCRVNDTGIYVDGTLVCAFQGNIKDRIHISIVVHGGVGGQVTCGSGPITVNGEVRSNVSSGSGGITVGGSVINSITTGSGDISIRGNVGNSVTTASGDVSVGGGINGNVKTVSGDIKVGNNRPVY
jgi:hypothetical protein